MPARKPVAEVVIEDEEATPAPTKTVAPAEAEIVEDEEPIIAQSASVDAVIKGTWTQIWGLNKFEFVDGKTYSIPRDLYNFLLARGCIYDIRLKG